MAQMIYIGIDKLFTVSQFQNTVAIGRRQELTIGVEQFDGGCDWQSG